MHSIQSAETVSKVYGVLETFCYGAAEISDYGFTSLKVNIPYITYISPNFTKALSNIGLRITAIMFNEINASVFILGAE